MNAAIVEMQGIRKEFNHIPVLQSVNFELRQGEIHSLLGENGAGKSTLMKILRGIYQPEGGEIRINGSVVRLSSPMESRANGIAMVFQEFSLIPTLTVAQNIYLTREARRKFGLLDDRQNERSAKALFDQLEVDIDPTVPVSTLSTGYRQLTEIAAALSQDARILILDEPTASLTHTETLALFKLMRKLKERGISMIYISHRMEEIFQITDRITVLRDGRNIVTDSKNNLTIGQVIEHILGHKAANKMNARKIEQGNGREVLLEVNQLSCAGGVKDVSFELHAGEVLGVAGLMGSGRTELMQAVFGIIPLKSGEIRVRGKKINPDRPESSMKAKIALIPEDRRVQGLIMNHTIKDNFVMPLIKLKRLNRASVFVDDRKGNALAESYISRLQIRSDSIYKEVRLLSGGNQQKVVIAKWLSTDPDILLMDEPTAGVDIGTKAEILEMARKLADQGKGIIIISSELQELLQVSDRILVLKKGRIFCEMDIDQIRSEEKLHQILQGA